MGEEAERVGGGVLVVKGAVAAVLWGRFPSVMEAGRRQGGGGVRRVKGGVYAGLYVRVTESSGTY